MHAARPTFTAERQLAKLGKRPLSAAPSAPCEPIALPVAGLAPGMPHQAGEMLDRLKGMEDKLDRFLRVDHTEIERIQIEVSDIAGRIQATKVEIAALRHPLENNGKFETAAAELGAVVSDTERATNTIMESAEKIEDILGEVIASLPGGGFQAARLADAKDLIVRVFEACNFQDITGQRINKVVRTISFIEDRVTAMMSVWHPSDLAALPMAPALDKVDGGLELTGPAGGGSKGSISQDDIDALFA
jgi:chemotaxis protein CheZ